MKRKTFFSMLQCDQSMATSAAFFEEVTSDFRTASPLMAFLTGAIDLPF